MDASATPPTVKRNRARSNTNIIKLKRRQTQDDVSSARLKDVEDDMTKRGEPTKKHVSHGYHSVQGRMQHPMEDFLLAKNVAGNELGLYAIFDGHSGTSVANYLQSHLFDNILKEPDFWENYEAAIKRAFEVTNNDILESVVGSKGGSTAVMAILVNREELVVANVGDSRAVLCKNGEAKAITVDHEPLKEKEMVENKG